MEGTRTMEVRLGPGVMAQLEEEGRTLDKTPVSIVEDMLIHWAHRQRVRKARIAQVEFKRSKVGGCP